MRRTTGSGSSAGSRLPDPEAVGADPSLRFGSAILSRWPLDAVELMSLPVSNDERVPSYLRARPPALPAGMPFALLHVRTAGIDVYSTHLQPLTSAGVPPRSAGAVHRRRRRTHVRSVRIDAAHPVRGLQRGAHVGRDPVPDRERGHRRAEHVLPGRVGGDPRPRWNDPGPRERSSTPSPMSHRSASTTCSSASRTSAPMAQGRC